MKKLSESVWADMHKRSIGSKIRKEDEINHLDRDGLYDYIFSIYKRLHLYPLPLKSQTSEEHTYFSIPIFTKNYKIYRLDASFHNDKLTKITLMASDADIVSFKKALIDKFTLTCNADDSLDVKSKDEKVSNQVIMDFIQTIVENCPEEAELKKRD